MSGRKKESKFREVISLLRTSFSISLFCGVSAGLVAAFLHNVNSSAVSSNVSAKNLVWSLPFFFIREAPNLYRDLSNPINKYEYFGMSMLSGVVTSHIYYSIFPRKPLIPKTYLTGAALGILWLTGETWFQARLAVMRENRIKARMEK